MKIKINYKVLLVTFAVAAFLFSCSEDFLVQNPRLSQSNELTLSSFKGLQSATASAYSRLCATGWYGCEMVALGDLKGGLGKRGAVTSGRYTNEYLWSSTPASTSGLWSQAYYTIARANNVITTIDGGFSENNVTQDQLDGIKGECLFLRAIAHFDLAREFALPYSLGRGNMGVPIVLVTANDYPARSTVGEVYDQVVADLTAAIPMLSDVNPRGGDHAWADKMAAKALLAKVNLYMENWQDAADLASDVISSGDYAMFTTADYQTWDKGGYWGGDYQGGGSTKNEIIFQVDGSDANSQQGYWESIAYETSPAGYGDVGASKDLLNMFEAGDVRRDSMFLEPSQYPNDAWTLKYPGRLGAIREFNFPVLRLSEMYLIRAEAVLNGASASATPLADYNMIRTNRGLAAATDVNLATIYDERARELCFEGNQLFDLARTQRNLVRTDYTGTSRKNVAFVKGGSADDNWLWAMPIPQTEMDANVNMVQNPKY